MEITIPQPLKSEHDELHAELTKATRTEGKIAEAAKAVAALLPPHFVKEEAYALPPLGLLPLLAEGKITPEMDQALLMTERLNQSCRICCKSIKPLWRRLKRSSMLQSKNSRQNTPVLPKS